MFFYGKSVPKRLETTILHSENTFCEGVNPKKNLACGGLLHKCLIWYQTFIHGCLCVHGESACLLCRRQKTSESKCAPQARKILRFYNEKTPFSHQKRFQNTLKYPNPRRRRGKILRFHRSGQLNPPCCRGSENKGGFNSRNSTDTAASSQYL